jgi:UPF0148 protein
MNEEEETKAMSRLLTRGAKMLQKGCDDCGNPLFRYRGEVVCPVCNERRGAEQKGEEKSEDTAPGGGTEKSDVVENTQSPDATDRDVSETSETQEEGSQKEATDGEVDENLRILAERLARDAVEHSDDPEAVERRLDALERTLGLLRR